MYLSFYHLKENPFQISADPKFLWLGPKHEEGLATLKYGVLDKKGFLLLTGDVGTGKTTLVNALLNTLGKDVLVAVIRDPNLEPLDFYNYIAHAFKMGREFERKGSFLIYFEKFLVEAHAAGKTVLLIIDESQRITQDLLEEVRLLSNIERHDCKLLNIFFVGQIEFNDILLRPENRAIRQRITVNYTIPTLTEMETGMYIRHRLEVAGLHEEIFSPQLVQEDRAKEYDEYSLELPEDQKEIFTFGAIQEIFSYSRGYPRLINIICDRCLLTGFVEDAAIITPEIVRECREELRIPESGLNVEEKKQGAPEITKAAVPLESDGIQENPAGTADGTAPGPESPTKRPNRFNVKLVMLLTVLIMVIAVGYTNLSKNDDQALLTNMIMRYAGDPGISTDDRVTGKAEEEKMLSLPARQVEEIPDERKKATEHAATVTERKNEEQDGGPRQNVEGSPRMLSSQAATRADTGNSRGHPAPAIEKSIIHFPKDSTYPSDISLAELNRLAENLLHQAHLKILITGYSDSSGNEQYNVKLSEFRANTVKSYMMGRGLPESRITVEGLGSQNPIASNDTVAGRDANRRVEIEIFNPADE
jgi:general secretion pathway protein A